MTECFTGAVAARSSAGVAGELMEAGKLHSKTDVLVASID